MSRACPKRLAICGDSIVVGEPGKRRIHTKAVANGRI